MAPPVPLSRRTILDGYCSMLVPGPITNSGTSDGGWMDNEGIRSTGMDPVKTMQYMPGTPVDCFYSNDAYAREGFTTITVQLNPPLECVQEASTRESLLSYLKNYAMDTENANYKMGLKRDIAVRRIDDPRSIQSSADCIVHFAFDVAVVATDPNLSPDLTSTTYIALVHFADKGNVLVKACNFERHSPPLDYETILGSIKYKADKAMFRGPDPEFRGLSAAARLLMNARGNRVDRSMFFGGKVCFHCAAASTPSGGPLLVCSKCKKGVYCSTKCQKKDWKRHKGADCV